jgi:hypothetical protein
MVATFQHNCSEPNRPSMIISAVRLRRIREMSPLHRGLLELVRILFWSNGKGPLILALFAAKKVDSGIAVEERGQFILVNNP